MQGQPNSRLDSWKAISAFLGRDVSTARRWEKESGLPVHRVPGNKRHAVYAYTDEMDSWLRGHSEPEIAHAGSSPEKRSRVRTTPLVVGAFLGTVVVVAVLGFTRSEASIHASQDAYHRGRQYWNARTSDDLRTAIEYFNQALEQNPRFAPAYSGLADSYTLLGLAGGGISAADVLPKAKSAALKAVELDPSLAEAHSSLAGVKAFYEWDWPGARREFERAVELGPGYAPAHHWFGIVYCAAQGRLNEAKWHMQRARELDPQSAIFATDAGWVLYLARQYDDAIGQYRQVLADHPKFGPALYRLGQACQAKGIYDENFAEILELYRAPKTSAKENAPQSESAYREVVRRQIDGFLKLRETTRVAPYYFAEQYTRLGETDQAIAWFEKALAERDPALIYLQVDPLFDHLRADPRFSALVQKIGIAPQR
jgi:tetratricopeptide (TPR) repeat protein